MVPGLIILKSYFRLSLFSEFEYKNDIQMKNKIYPTLARISSNEIIKRTPKSRETIPFKVATKAKNALQYILHV
jgi:hypothetical protein